MRKRYRIINMKGEKLNMSDDVVGSIVELEEVEEVKEDKPLSLEEQVRIRQMLALQNVAPRVKETLEGTSSPALRIKKAHDLTPIGTVESPKRGNNWRPRLGTNFNWRTPNNEG